MSNNTRLAPNPAVSAVAPILCAFGIAGTGVSSPKGADFGPAPMRGRHMDVYVTAATQATGPCTWSPPIT
ncbi:MAG: hypothetical protein M3130_08545 [Actinomycetota bacterium]|nr:hypothetical protein [Actinomycetota bacterium]